MENSNRPMAGIIPAIVIAAGIVVGSFLISPGLNKIASSLDEIAVLAEKSVKNQAIDGCYQTGRVTRIDDKNGTTVIPEKSWTAICLKDKGIK